VEDAADVEIARRRLAEIEAHPDRLVSGAELEARLDLMERAPKHPDAFRGMEEVARELRVPPQTLRYWESRLGIRVTRSGGGQRLYRPRDVELLRRIKYLLYVDCYRIEGVRRLLHRGRLPHVPSQEQQTAANH
jgi:hypothetical protein